MRKGFLLLLMMTFCWVVTAVAAGKKFTLVIDAGHGGHDAGAVGAVAKEKTINLNVALAFGRLVERHCPDVKVIYTRKTDVFVPLHTRADIANRNKADLFISIHTNALPKGRISRGLETYTLGMHRAADNLDVAKRENSVILIEKDYKQRYQGFDPNSSESYIMFEFIQDRNMAQSVELARSVQKFVCSRAGRQNKGVKQAGFLVLRETSMPSCLIELGFISTADEEKYLISDAGVQQMGRGIFEAFLDYRQKKEGGSLSVVRLPDLDTTADVKPADTDDTPAVRPSKKASAVAKELADAREGRTPQVQGPRPSADNEGPAGSEDPEPEPEQIPEDETPTPQAAQQPAPQPAEKPAVKPAEAASAPVFKVQILASATRLKLSDALLKGQKNVGCYQDGGMYKYTVGASENYNEIYQLRKTLTARFPQAFIIAFKDGRRTDVQQAVQEFKRKKVKQ